MNNITTPPAIVQEVDQLAETLTSLQGVISRNAGHLKQLKDEKKHIKEQEQNILDNNDEYCLKRDDIADQMRGLKEIKAKVKGQRESLQLSAKKRELSQQEKEIKQTISNHLANYYSLTGNNTFDTLDGEQVEFKVSASFNSKQLSLF